MYAEMSSLTGNQARLSCVHSFQKTLHISYHNTSHIILAIYPSIHAYSIRRSFFRAEALLLIFFCKEQEVFYAHSENSSKDHRMNKCMNE